MTDCVFCKIVAKDLPSKLLYEDDEVLAFHDIHPAAPVHFLIVSKEHLASLAACETRHAALLGKMSLLAPKLAQEQGCGVRQTGNGAAGGFKVVYHIGPDGGQVIDHLHMHVLGGPRPWRV